MRDVESLWKAGLALGASLNNTIALADDRIMNAEGLRYPQEFVRHKMLDAMGDLALAGAPDAGLLPLRARRPSAECRRVVQALLADTEAWTMVRAPWVRDTVPVDVSVGVGRRQLRRRPHVRAVGLVSARPPWTSRSATGALLARPDSPPPQFAPKSGAILALRRRTASARPALVSCRFVC